MVGSQVSLVPISTFLPSDPRNRLVPNDFRTPSRSRVGVGRGESPRPLTLGAAPLGMPSTAIGAHANHVVLDTNSTRQACLPPCTIKG
jgi:hypothetical protein